MNSAELKRAKKEIRRRVLAARDAIPGPARERAAAAVAERFLSLPEVEGAQTVMMFWSFGSELPLGRLIEALVNRGIEVALPRIVAGELEPRSWRPGEAMSDTTFGAREPVGGRVVPDDEVDVVVTPAVAFDRWGRRIGYGGGFYDRFLPRTRSDALRAGVGYGIQLLDEPLPAGHFDLGVDVLITEAEVIRCAS